ncbi:MAG TPA: CPBP family intramembrane glutamic endopeptidase [Dyella sp.]|uniref:CPBP family intramembrane glutamic endopeptidase n=1 Tax=Dyella sp. TaxID=1869338 RepID=UPI002C1C09A9|nr:CPBP family intramembrane glutamic endopeptidase [Dyella sp.]HUB89386.1 CPBP family intramembrane glutamic endopeptidase [Dyella sp.]
MITMLSIGLGVSLGGPLLFVLAAKRFSLNSLSIPGRLVLWLLAAATLVIAAYGGGAAWLGRIGVKPFGWFDLASVVVAVIAMVVGAIALQILVTKLGFKDRDGSKLYQKIHSLSVPRRLFVVVTAAVAEEVLYRGYAIGIGQDVLGGLTIAFVVSLFVFVAAHFAYGAKALATIFWISLVMSFLFIYTGNLFACIIAHFIIDVVGTLFVPWVAARHRAQAALSASKG